MWADKRNTHDRHGNYRSWLYFQVLAITSNSTVQNWRKRAHDVLKTNCAARCPKARVWVPPLPNYRRQPFEYVSLGGFRPLNPKQQRTEQQCAGCERTNKDLQIQPVSIIGNRQFFLTVNGLIHAGYLHSSQTGILRGKSRQRVALRDPMVCARPRTARTRPRTPFKALFTVFFPHTHRQKVILRYGF